MRFPVTEVIAGSSPVNRAQGRFESDVIVYLGNIMCRFDSYHPDNSGCSLMAERMYIFTIALNIFESQTWVLSMHPDSVPPASADKALCATWAYTLITQRTEYWFTKPKM